MMVCNETAEYKKQQPCMGRYLSFFFQKFLPQSPVATEYKARVFLFEKPNLQTFSSRCMANHISYIRRIQIVLNIFCSDF